VYRHLHFATHPELALRALLPQLLSFGVGAAVAPVFVTVQVNGLRTIMLWSSTRSLQAASGGNLVAETARVVAAFSSLLSMPHEHVRSTRM
jgi:hypothetical protein